MFKELQLCLDVRFSGSSGEGWQLASLPRGRTVGPAEACWSGDNTQLALRRSTGKPLGSGRASADLTKDLDLTFQSQGLRLAPERALED